MKNNTSKLGTFCKAVLLGLFVYLLCCMLAAMTLGFPLLPIQEWKTFSDPIPFVSTLHFVFLAGFIAFRFYKKRMTSK